MGFPAGGCGQYLADEFGEAKEDAQMLLEDYRIALSRSPIEVAAGQNLVLEVSGALYFVRHWPADLDLDQAIEIADQLLYQVKMQGRNRTVMQLA